MTNILDFIDQVTSDNKILQKFREETQVAAPTEDDIEWDNIRAIDEDELEDPVDAPKKLKRRVSQTLIEMLHRYDSRLKCEYLNTQLSQ